MRRRRCHRCAAPCRAEIQSEVLAPWSRCEALRRHEAECVLGSDWNVNQARVRIERHLRCVVHLHRIHRHALLRRIQRVGVNIGTAGFWIDSGSPAHLRHLGRGDEFAVGAIDHVEVPVLVRLHDDLTIAIVDPNIRKQKVLNRVVVPLIARGALVVPLQLTGVCVNSDNGGDVEIVRIRSLPATVPNVR